MIGNRFNPKMIYLYRHPVDMRKSMDALAFIVESNMQLNPFDNQGFLFINRARDKIKLLLWESNGFWLCYKKLVKQRFQWPDWFAENTLNLSHEQCDLLLQGFNLNGMRPHNKLFFDSVAGSGLI